MHQQLQHTTSTKLDEILQKLYWSGTAFSGASCWASAGILWNSGVPSERNRVVAVRRSGTLHPMPPDVSSISTWKSQMGLGQTPKTPGEHQNEWQNRIHPQMSILSEC
jgi:hypothetical protein